ncbi:hypothetical protein [Halobacteriovorax sp. HLS]|uniref:hypothetical protein n=1 Tax=Halobacteriovorax sp. HLS TaxID=2234000 RepID=UPI000FD71018|nr:hypothetical protein [Halobacteriovorax sp. HLS]
MKKLFNVIRRTRQLALLTTLLFSFNSLGESPELMIRSVKGNAFLVTKEKTTLLKAGDHVYDFQQIFTEVGSQVSFVNYQDQLFHLAGGGNIRSLKGIIELQNGYLWMESISGSSAGYQVQTPNARLEFSNGESIIDFDNSSGKTQLLVLNGTVEFGNLFQDHLTTEVSSGKFSFISKDYENGAPRNPTPVGKNTFAKVQGLFDKKNVAKKPTKNVASILSSEDIAPIVSKKTVQRTIASVAEEPVAPSRVSNSAMSQESGIIYIRPKKRDLQKDDMLLNYHSQNITKLKAKKVKKKFAPSYASKSKVKVYVFGQKKKKSRSIASVKKKSTRAPASIQMEPAVKLKNDAFESSLMREYSKQLRHSKEVNSLIQELKNYDQDYKQSY